MKISNITQSLSRLNSGANQQQPPANYAAAKSLKYSSDATDVKPVVTPVKSRTDDELCAANALVGINFGAGIALPLPLPISTPQVTPTASQPVATVEIKREPTVTSLVSKIGIPNGQLRPPDACDADSNESLETSKSEASERQKKNDQTNIGTH